MMMKHYKVFITGFTGAGKSHLINKLSSNNSDNRFHYIDLDAEIIKSEGKTIPEIVEGRGWDYFREVESRILNSYLDQEFNFIMALGGGALTTVALRKIEGAEGKIVWLDIPFEICWERIKKDTNRPLVKKGKEEVLAIYHERAKRFKDAKYRLDEESAKKIENIGDLLFFLDGRGSSRHT